jgi:pSer/pThr/pTyr-binding forkhead associated (FHA) protein
MAIHLLVLAGKHAGQKIALPATQFVIGRDGSCHIRPISMDVSKFHCAIAQHHDRIVIRDLKSTNGTFLNGNRVCGTAKAHHGDVLKVGPLEFMVQVEQDKPLRCGEGQLDWLMRSPTDLESEVLDPEQDTSIIEIFPIGTSAESKVETAGNKRTPAYSKEATAVAGRFMREYMATRKRPKPTSSEEP